MLPKALSVLAATALAGAALAVPGTASATTDRDLRWSAVGSTVTLESPRDAVFDIAYTCGTANAPRDVEVSPGLLQPVYVTSTAVAFRGQEGFPSFTCDGTPRTQTVRLGVKEGTFENGSAELGLIFGDPTTGTPTFEHVTLTGLPDPRAEVAISVNATPEPVKKGRTITVKGTVTRDGKAYSKKKATLYFAPDNREAVKVKTVTTSSKGALRTTVEATRSGRFFWVTGSTSKTQQGTSGVDRVKVK